MDERARRPREVRCATCGRSWPATRDTCPYDGTALPEDTLQAVPQKRSDWEGRTVEDHDTGTLPQIDPHRGVADTVRSPDATRDSLSEIPASQLPSLAPGTRVGDYEIEKRIGEGAMSEVYLAVHSTIGRKVAIKVVSRRFEEPGATDRFLSEARTVAAIHHPGIVHVFGFGTFPDGRGYLIMEWLSGESLGARMTRGPVPFDDALEIILQIVNALRAAHDHAIVHRDLKPDNVFLQEIRNEKPIVKLLDFGLAKRLADADSLTRAGQLIGTPMYMSPEQIRAKPVDHRTDVYALGCICYELLAGRLPFLAQTITELIVAHTTEPPPDPRTFAPEMPEQLARLVRDMLAKDRQKRPELDAVRRVVQAMLLPSQMMAAVSAEPRIENVTDPGLPLPPPAQSFPPIEISAVTKRERRSRGELDGPTVDGKPLSRKKPEPSEAETLDDKRRPTLQGQPVPWRAIWLGVALLVVLGIAAVIVSLTAV